MRLGASAKDNMAPTPDVRRPATAIGMVVTRDDGQLPPMEFRGGKRRRWGCVSGASEYGHYDD